MYGFGGVSLSEVQLSISELSVVGGGWVVVGGGLDKRTSWSDLHRVRQLSSTYPRQGTGKTNPRLAAIFVLLGRNDSGSIQYCCNAVSSLSLAFQNILQLFYIYDSHCWCYPQKNLFDIFLLLLDNLLQDILNIYDLYFFI